MRIIRPAFTLAEVLITLGIIGVVAAMTMPTLIQKHKKQVVISRLQKASATIGQAYNMATAKYGIKPGDSSGFTPYNPDEAYEQFNKYYAPFMKISKIEKGTRGVFAYLQDGTALYFYKDGEPEYWGRNTYMLVCIDYKACQKLDESKYVKVNGKDIFTFYVHGYAPNYISIGAHYTREQQIDMCKRLVDIEACTALIVGDGWQIKDDYPHKF